MHSLTKNMIESFENLEDFKLYVKASKESLKLEASFELKEDYEIENEAIDDLKGTKCVISISIVKSGEDEHIVQFVRKEGEFGDYYELFIKMKEITLFYNKIINREFKNKPFVSFFSASSDFDRKKNWRKYLKLMLLNMINIH